MKFNYQNPGDVLYGIEEYLYRYKNQEAATIKLSNLNILEENEFAFRVIIHDEDVPDHYKDTMMNDYTLFEEFGKRSIVGLPKTKKDALQLAIDQANMILEKYGSAIKKEHAFNKAEQELKRKNNR